MSLATRIAQEFKNTKKYIGISGVTSYHLLKGNLAVSSYTITQGFNTTLYTGNGGTQVINTGVDMATQWGDDASERFGGLVWLKSRSGTQNNAFIDTVRGNTKIIQSNTTNAESTSSTLITSFNNNGISLGSDNTVNGAFNYASWNFQTTHRVTGTTNHGKAYECHYNPFTGFTMVKYEGSGISGHEIPHHLGRKLGISFAKNLSSASTQWAINVDAIGRKGWFTTSDMLGVNWDGGNENIFSPIYSATLEYSSNTSGQTYILYGWANSYFDEDNTLIGNYEIGVYQGTGVAGNKITTRGKPAWIMIKRLDSTGNWVILDNQRSGLPLFPSQPWKEDDSDGNGNTDLNGAYWTINSDGFTLNYVSLSSNYNASGGQYLYMVAYDTNANGGGSYYPLASDTSNLQIQNAIIPFANGIDSNGAKNTILSKNETITGLTYTAGKNYVYCDSTGAYGVSAHKPRYLESELIRTYAGETPDYYNVKENKWYSTSGGSELLGTTGWTATGGTLTTVGGYNQFVDTTLTGYVSKTISTVVGKAYTIVLKTFGTREANITINNVEYQWVNGTFIGTKTINFVANDVATVIAIKDGSGSSYTIQFSASMFETAILPSTAITNSRNYMNNIVYADNDGGVLYVEELPKIEYKDIVKANEFKGKNACTAWVNFDGTTTPPTIRDSYNVSAVIRTATGFYDVYFKEPMDNKNFTVSANNMNGQASYVGSESGGYANRSLMKCNVINVYPGVSTANADMTVNIFGGKN